MGETKPYKTITHNWAPTPAALGGDRLDPVEFQGSSSAKTSGSRGMWNCTLKRRSNEIFIRQPVVLGRLKGGFLSHRRVPHGTIIHFRPAIKGYPQFRKPPVLFDLFGVPNYVPPGNRGWKNPCELLLRWFSHHKTRGGSEFPSEPPLIMGG